MKSYKEFHIKTEPFIPDLLSGLLWEINISGLTEEDNYVKIFSEKNKISKAGVEDLLIKLKDEELITGFTIEEFDVENKNWNEEWEKNLNVIKVTDKIIIKPSSREYLPNGNEIVLTIDPKMSFGTGEHQTTRLMLRMIEKYVRPGMMVLDIGSGTAVLAIAAVKLGAEHAIAIDNDELCYDNGKENISLNDVEEKIEIRTGELKDISENDFDLILANIQKNILIDIAPEISNRLNAGGTLILSGLLKDDETDIAETYKKLDFIIAENQSMDEWIVLVLKRV